MGTMRSRGVKLISTQWTGWVPGADRCPGGNNLGGSVFTVKNVRVYGSFVHGKRPPLCQQPAPTSPPQPTPPTSPPKPNPNPSGHKLYCPDQSDYDFFEGAHW